MLFPLNVRFALMTHLRWGRRRYEQARHAGAVIGTTCFSSSDKSSPGLYRRIADGVAAFVIVDVVIWISRIIARRQRIFLAVLIRSELVPPLATRPSKHRDRPHHGGRQKYWIKVKNRTHPAMERVIESGASNVCSR
jgi:hypothetical protein